MKFNLKFYLIFFVLVLFAKLEASDEKNKALFESKCSSCHPTALPLSKNKTPEDWAGTVKRMQTKMKILSNEEIKLIVEYLSELRGINEDDPLSEEIKYMDNSLEQGKKLFSDFKLGGNGKSCVSCHTDEQNPLKKRALLYPKYYHDAHKVISLEQRVNYCIMKYMEGEALRLGSEEIISITVYLYSLL